MTDISYEPGQYDQLTSLEKTFNSFAYGIIVTKPSGHFDVIPFGGYDSAYSAYVDWQKDEPDSIVEFYSQPVTLGPIAIHEHPSHTKP